MARGRPVALVTAVVLLLEAVGIGVLFWVVGVMADRQEMSLDGLDPHLVAVSAWTCGAVLGVHLVLCGALLLRAALTGRPPGRPARVLLVCAAVVHGVLGAVTAALVSWTVFAGLMAVPGLVVLSLVFCAPDRPAAAPAAGEPPLRPTTP